MTTLLVDFNDLKGPDLIRALSSSALEATSELFVGDVVKLMDSEGNIAEGLVEEIRGRLTLVRVDWDTWHSVGDCVSAENTMATIGATPVVISSLEGIVAHWVSASVLQQVQVAGDLTGSVTLQLPYGGRDQAANTAVIFAGEIQA